MFGAGPNLFGGNNAGAASTPSLSPFGLQTSSNQIPSEQQKELLRQQMLAFGIDVNTMPPVMQSIIARVENPSMKTLQLLVKIINRLQTLENLKNRNDDLISFVYNRAPNAEMALRLQAACDERAAAMGSALLQKLNRFKKVSPKEPRTEFYTEFIVGFDGLRQRVSEQARFFENFNTTLRALQERQKKAHQNFHDRVIGKLHRIRNTQSELRDRAINLISALNELASKNQGFDGDEDDLLHVHSEYERMVRMIRSAPDCLLAEVPLLKKRLGALREKPCPLADAVTTARGASTGVTSNQRRVAQDELAEMTKRNHEELEQIKKRLITLAVDIQDLVLASETAI